MSSEIILYPVIGLIWWTTCVLLLIPYRRFKAALRGEVVMDDFKLGESERVDAYVAVANRNYMNLLEFPILFYVICLTIYVTATVTTQAFVLACAYVALRVAHSLVHLCYNNVAHRLILFATSNFVLVGLLIMLTTSILTPS